MMYGYSSFGGTPSTPPRPSRSSTSTAQTPGRSLPGGAPVLPPTPGAAQSSVTVTTAGTGTGDTGNGGPALVTYTAISQEYASLRYPGHCPLGMYLIPDKDNAFVWDGVFFVHQGSSLVYTFAIAQGLTYPHFDSTSALHLLASALRLRPIVDFPDDCPGHEGYYSDCILKFRLVFPQDYPNSSPQVQFLTDVFHPLISQKDGSFNLSPRFRPWR